MVSHVFRGAAEVLGRDANEGRVVRLDGKRRKGEFEGKTDNVRDRTLRLCLARKDLVADFIGISYRSSAERRGDVEEDRSARKVHPLFFFPLPCLSVDLSVDASALDGRSQVCAALSSFSSF